MPNNIRVMDKVRKMDKVTTVQNVGFLSEHVTVNCYGETDDSLRFYISFDKLFDGWGIDYTRDPEVKMRSKMHIIRHIKNQTQTLKVVEALINHRNFTIDVNGECIINE